MADQDDLRFTMELKDEFTEVFNKIKDTVSETVPKLKADLGGLSKTLAVIGGAAAIGGVVYGAWTMFKNKIADVTKEAEALQSTLANILGSKGAAKNVLDQLANSDLTKVFKIKEIDEGYTNLANHGLKATLAQMTAIGDLSAGTGKDFGSVIDAILKGGEGKIMALQNLGINVVKNKGTKTTSADGLELSNGFEVKGKKTKSKIDDLTLSFRGQTTTIKNNAAAIQQYLLNLGMIPGVQGSMARSADTVTASENNLNNQISKLWENLGERFNPGVVENKNLLSKWIGTINQWIAIPTSEKIQDEVVKLQGLKAQLGFTNTTEAERRKILQQVKDIQPDIVDGTKSEKEQLDSLTDSLDKYIGKRREQIALEQLKEANLGDVTSFKEAQNLQLKSQGQADAAVGMAQALGLDISGMTQGQAQMAAKDFLKKRIASGKETNRKVVNIGSAGVGGAGQGEIQSDERNALRMLERAFNENNKASEDAAKALPGYQQYLKAQEAIKKLLPGQASPLDAIAGKDSGIKTTSIDKGGIASVNGGGQIKNITINIQNLVNGGVNVHSTTLKEGVSKAKDIVVEGLLTAVNDANLVAN